MNDLIKLLDKNLEYINHNIEKDTIYINVKSIKKEVKCPYCNNYSTKVHSKYKKSFQDLPIQGMKVIIIIDNRKMFCKNDACNHTTFSEKFKFIHDKAKRTKRLEEKIKLVREMHKVGYSIRAISRELHMARETVSKYLKPDVSAIHACYGIKKDGGILLPYKDKINEYFSKRFNFKDIEANIRLQGYTGSISLLRKYVTTLKLDTKLQYEKSKSNNKNVIYIERKLIMKLLYKPLDKIKQLDKSLFELLCEQCPHVNEILDVVNNFRDILKSKKISKLDTWIEKTFSLGISELKSFINGLNQDIEAVRNSISLEYNNGLAEGSVNKIKVIKRIMYGRCNFETLRNKIIKLENLK